MSTLRVSKILGNTQTLGQVNILTGNELNIKGVLDMNRKDAYQLPSGTTAQRPASPSAGYLRFNTDDGVPECWNGTEWIQTLNVITGADGEPVTPTHLTPTSLISQTPIIHLDANDTSSYPGSGSTWSDLSPNNNDFTISGPTFVAGTASTPAYFSLDGTNDIFSRTSVPLSNYTFECWGWSDDQGTTDGSDYGYFFSDINLEAGLAMTEERQSANYYMYIGTLYYYNGVGANSGVNTMGFSVPRGQWFHLVMVDNHPSNQLTFYLNGRKVGVYNKTDGDLAGVSHIGMWAGNSTHYWQGRFAEMRWYDQYYMSDEDVIQNYIFRKSRYGIT